MPNTAVSVIGRAEQTPAAFSHAEILRVILGVLVCIFLAALDLTVVILALPAIAHDLNSYQQS